MPEDKVVTPNLSDLRRRLNEALTVNTSHAPREARVTSFKPSAQDVAQAYDIPQHLAPFCTSFDFVDGNPDHDFTAGYVDFDAAYDAAESDDAIASALEDDLAEHEGAGCMYGFGSNQMIDSFIFNRVDDASQARNIIAKLKAAYESSWDQFLQLLKSLGSNHEIPQITRQKG